MEYLLVVVAAEVVTLVFMDMLVLEVQEQEDITLKDMERMLFIIPVAVEVEMMVLATLVDWVEMV